MRRREGREEEEGRLGVGRIEGDYGLLGAVGDTTRDGGEMDEESKHHKRGLLCPGTGS